MIAMTSAPTSGRKVIRLRIGKRPMSIVLLPYLAAMRRYEPTITISPIAMPSA